MAVLAPRPRQDTGRKSAPAHALETPEERHGHMTGNTSPNTPSQHGDNADMHSDLRERGKEQADNSPVTIQESTIYSFNLDDRKTPGGMKVRWKIRVVDGPAAARYDAPWGRTYRP
jgi:hypothetical protein